MTFTIINFLLIVILIAILIWDIKNYNSRGNAIVEEPKPANTFRFITTCCTIVAITYLSYSSIRELISSSFTYESRYIAISFSVLVMVVFSAFVFIDRRTCPKCKKWLRTKTIKESDEDDDGLTTLFYKCNNCGCKWDIKINRNTSS
jgi:RNase P subunit RPR2